MIDIVGRIRWIRDRANQIFDLVVAILTLTETGGTITTTAAEQDVYINETPAGVFNPRKFQIDLSNMAAADTIRLRVSYRINTDGDKKKKDERQFTGVQDPTLINIELEPNRFGIQVTIQRLAGADQDYDFCVFYGV